MWEAIKYVSSTASLLAFIAAAIVTIIMIQLHRKERLIKLAKQGERADLIRSVINNFGIATDGLKPDAVKLIVLEQIRARSERFKSVIKAILIIASLSCVVALFTIYTTARSQPVSTPVDRNTLAKDEFEFTTVYLDANGSDISEKKLKAKQLIEDLKDGVTLEMVAVPGGSFLMGTTENDIKKFDLKTEIVKYFDDSSFDPKKNIDAKKEWENLPYSETPQHTVTISPFYIGKYEITQKQWRQVVRTKPINYIIPENPSVHNGDNKPVEGISFRAAMEFCARLSKLTGKKYHLPTEAEWEYACRAGTNTQFSFGDNIQPGYANYNGSCQFGSGPRGLNRKTTTDVGAMGVANQFGIYDMEGNVWEWCLDRWHPNYQGAPNDGSAWLQGGLSEYRVVRGGSWFWLAYGCRSAYRNYREEAENHDIYAGSKDQKGNHGLRVVLEN